ncbi:DnaJ domain-containing protein [Aspergillus crustosus]
MPCPRSLRGSIAQIYLEPPCCYTTIPILPRDHISSTISNIRSRRQRTRYGRIHRASFSTSRSPRLASPRDPSYYEILDIPVTATPAEIKKQFYSLSLRHHPDRNRNDPGASSRFAKISSAYQTLSNTTKRATYDRDHGIHAFSSSSTHSTANPGQHPMGSYSSYSQHGSGGGGGASYFGSRPASGLSKRRGTFRGPPPSFYAHGGYGNRKAPKRDSGFTAGAAGGTGTKSSYGPESGKNEDPMSFIDRNPISHFNARGHYRTQTAEDQRREQRRSRQARAAINDQYIGSRSDFIMRFISVFGILFGAAALTGIRLTDSPSDIAISGTGRGYSSVKDS